MEPYIELFDLLESNNAQSVDEAKKQLHNCFNSVKESWLVNGMTDYYMNTNSIRIVEIFVCMREPHEIFLFDKLSESLKNNQKSQALSLLGHIVSRNPTWMYKIVKHQLMKDLFKVLKSEVDIIPLMSALLSLIILLPILAGCLGPYLQDVFEVFSRLAAWNTNNPSKMPEGQLLHLQLGLHALFNRLYGMYPWSFLNHLRNLYSIKDNIPVFHHTVVPMLDTVKMHPLLVTTTSKEKEVSHPRWKKMEVNDVILECAKLAVDYSDKPKDDYGSFRARTASLRSTSSLDYSASAYGGSGGGGGDGRSSVGVASFSANLSETGDVWSPTVFASGNTPPGSAPTSIPHTPISQTYVSSTNLPQHEGTSPPEAAVEATPESTPVRDMRQRGRERPSVVGPIMNINSSLMGGSQPSSPLRKDTSIFRYPSSSPLTATTDSTKNPYHTAKVCKLEYERSQDTRCSAVSPQKMMPLEDNLGNEFQTIQDSCEQEDKEVEATLSHHINTAHQSTTPSNFEERERERAETWVEYRGPRHHHMMPDSQSMMQFTKRLRNHSYCFTDPNPPNMLQDVSTGSSPGEGGKVSNLQVRRAISCPEMKKPTGSSLSTDFTPLALDETAEEEELINGHQSRVENCNEEKKLVDRMVQTDEMPPLLGYEHLFFALYPTSDQPSIHSAPPNVTCPPMFPSEMNQNKFTPSTALENYIDASVKASSVRHHGNVPEFSDLKTCKEHISLLMLQLQFERHRREVHAERNRRLLGKSRSNSALEEHNNALKDQVGLLQKDIETLRSELERVKYENKLKIETIHEGVILWQDKCGTYEKQSKESADKVSSLEQELKDQKVRFDAKLKEYNECKAVMFELENSVRCLSEKAKEGDSLRDELVRLQYRLLASTENDLKLRTAVDRILLRSRKAEEHLLATHTYNHQIQTLEQQLETKAVQVDALKAKLADIESNLTRKDSAMSQSEDRIQSIKDDYATKLKGLENKCDDLRRMNSKLEDTNLELLHRIEMVELSGKKVHNQSSPPLSASLSSSGNLSLSGGESGPLTNLQLIVDQSEPSSSTGFRDSPSPT